MKNLLMVAMVATAFGIGMSSCNNDDEIKPREEAKDEIPANIATEIGTRGMSVGPLSLFKDGDQLGLFATRGNLGENYNDFPGYSNVKSIRQGGVWLQEPPIYLTGENCKIYAYHPYKAGLKDGANIDIEATSQTDYMYGTHNDGDRRVNSDNPNVLIQMRHALSLVQFNIYKKNYNAVGKLTRIAIKGNGSLYKTAKLNCQTGVVVVKDVAEANGIVVENTASGLVPSIGTTVGLDESAFPKVMNLPVASTMRDGDVTATFTIDGKDYVYKFAAGTTWESGKKYTYTIVLNGTSINIDGDGSGTGDSDVNIDEWGNTSGNPGGTLK